MKKVIIYSLLPRLWGNSQENLVPNGTYEENGCGKLEALDESALAYIRSMGCTHLWCIGLLEHATTTSFGTEIPSDPIEMVKGRAGSPYALKDYYDIAPSLATCLSDRMQEFEALVERVHRAGLKLLIDFIPNHVARTYASDSAPDGVVDLGQDDDRTVHFDAQNNFYYFPDQELRLPTGDWQEYPAKATGNDCFSPTPSHNDWYETIKLNYGVDYLAGGEGHFDPIPKTWVRMLEILDFWAAKGVDGFRCDMAEMVPEAFWAWAIPQLRSRHRQELCFLAEIYQPHRYWGYIAAGFDYLYDKVGVYDTLRAIACGSLSASAFDSARDAVGELQGRMCYFLENHDEHRLPSAHFAGNAEIGVPALATLLFSGQNPYLHYFGQELGEEGMQAEGFSGLDGRTTIFDYWSLDKVRRLRRDYSGAELTPEELRLLEDYRRLMLLAQSERVFTDGHYYGLNYVQTEGFDTHRCLAYLRYTDTELALVVTNFAPETRTLNVHLPKHVFDAIGWADNEALSCTNLLQSSDAQVTTLSSFAPLVLDLAATSVCLLRFRRLSSTTL